MDNKTASVQDVFDLLGMADKIQNPQDSCKHQWIPTTETNIAFRCKHCNMTLTRTKA